MRIFKSSRWLTLAFAALAIGSGFVSAERITEDKAREVVINFLSGKERQGILKKSSVRVSKHSEYSVTSSGTPLYYVFNNGSGSGFTIVSGDDRLPAVLGYTTSGDFEYDRLPDNLKWWLGEYAREIDYIYAHEVEQKLPARVIVSNNRERIEQKLTTTWDQRSPYNYLCPEDENGRSVTGCVATAMAQVINYHEWPLHGMGERNGINFEEATYDYANMLDSYTEPHSSAEALAVATLMRHCGAAVNMSYSSQASGSSDVNMHMALLENFRYNPGTQLLFRDFYSLSEWEDLVYNELDKNGPVLYCGSSLEWGHCFVVDGYEDDGYFHLNWGWSGYQDGFFLLNVLNPLSGGTGSYDGGYNYAQSIISDLSPAGQADTEPQTMLYCNGELVYSEEDNGILVPEDYGGIFNMIGRTQKGVMRVAFENADNPKDVTYAGNQEYELPPYYGYTGVEFEQPELLDGIYKVYPVYKDETDSDYEKVIINPAMPQYIIATVQNGQFTYKLLDLPPEIYDERGYITAVDGIDKLYSTVDNTVKVTFSNTGNQLMEYTYGIELSSVENPSKVTRGYFKVNLDKGQSDTYEVGLNFSRVSEDYVLKFFKGKTHRIYYDYEIPVKVLDAPEIDIAESYPISLDAMSQHFFSNGKEATPIVTFKNSTGADQIVSFGFKMIDDRGNEVYQRRTGEVSFKPSETKSVYMPLGTLDITPGTYLFVTTVSNSANGDIDVPVSVQTVNVRSNYLDGSDIAYFVTSEEDGRAHLSAPRYGSYYAEEVEIPELIDGKYTVSVLDGTAFVGNNMVTSVTIPSTVTAIAPGVFNGATALKSIRFNSATPPVLGDDVFSDTGRQNTLLYVPAGTAGAYKAAKGWESFHVPSWQFQFGEEGLSVNGIDTSKPYYVGSDEAIEILLNGKAKQFHGRCTFSDGTVIYLVGEKSLQLPALGTLDGICYITTELSGISDILGEDGTVDVYSINGYLVLKNADREDIDTLPAGIYIAGGNKLIKH